MGRVRGVSDQDQVAVPPRLRAQSCKTDPAAAVAEQRVSSQCFRKHLGTERDSLLVAIPWFPRAVRVVELAAANPAVLFALDDERAHRLSVRGSARLHGSYVSLAA